VSSADVAEPLSDFSHDFVDLERLQKGRFLFQLRTPYLQDFIFAPFILLVIAFITNLLDGRFPFLKMHRLFLFDFGTRSGGRNSLKELLEAMSVPETDTIPL
jgi:hypothetical protein